ncbi:hypothetical protein Hanom_Chr14g01286971 [Helianthus anomalus]
MKFINFSLDLGITTGRFTIFCYLGFVNWISSFRLTHFNINLFLLCISFLLSFCL